MNAAKTGSGNLHSYAGKKDSEVSAHSLLPHLNAQQDKNLDRDFRTENFERVSAPLLKILFPVCAGFALAGLMPNLRCALPAFVFAAIFFAGVFFSAKFYRVKTRRAFYVRKTLKCASLFGGVFCAAALWFFARTNNADEFEFTASEASVKLDILGASENSAGGMNGKARIVSVDFGGAEEGDARAELQRRMVGQTVWYNFFNDRKRTHSLKLVPTQTVEAFGAINPINPEENSFSKYLYYRGFAATFSAYMPNCKTSSPASGFFKMVGALAEYANEKLSPTLFDSGGALSEANRIYRAMLLGNKSLLDKDAKKIYSQTGVMHIFAVSGLHISTAAFAMAFLLALLKVPWRIQPFICGPLVFGYAAVCGLPPSALRAAAMICMVWLFCAFMRKPKPFAALVLTAFIMLLANPPEIFDAGFTLSYSAVAAIIIYGVALAKFLTEKFRPYKLIPIGALNMAQKSLVKISVCFGGAFAIAVAATLATTPLTLYYFGVCAPLSIFYSVFYVLGASACVGFGICSLMLPESLSAVLNSAGSAISYALDRFAALIGSWDICVQTSINSYCAALLALLAFFACAIICAKMRTGKAAFFLLPPTLGISATLLACFF